MVRSHQNGRWKARGWAGSGCREKVFVGKEYEFPLTLHENDMKDGAHSDDAR